jgi:hypothetical protein
MNGFQTIKNLDGICLSYLSEIDDHVYIIVFYTDFMDYKSEPGLGSFEAIEKICDLNNKKECTIYEFHKDPNPIHVTNWLHENNKSLDTIVNIR